MFSTGRAQVNVTDPVGLAIVAAILIAVAALAHSRARTPRDAFGSNKGYSE